MHQETFLELSFDPQHNLFIWNDLSFPIFLAFQKWLNVKCLRVKMTVVCEWRIVIRIAQLSSVLARQPFRV